MIVRPEPIATMALPLSVQSDRWTEEKSSDLQPIDLREFAANGALWTANLEKYCYKHEGYSSKRYVEDWNIMSLPTSRTLNRWTYRKSNAMCCCPWRPRPRPFEGLDVLLLL
jgi:hypothetical protein